MAKYHVSSSEVDDIVEVLENNLGEKWLLDEIVSYMHSDEIGNILLDIAKNWDCYDECFDILEDKQKYK